MKPERVKKGRGVSPPDAVIESRVSEMINKLSTCTNVQRSQLHKEFCKKWRVHWKTVDRLVGRAREAIFKRLGRSKESFRAESLAFYEALTVDSDASVADKTRARQRIDDLLGLDPPKRQEVSGVDGGPVAIEDKTQPKLHPDVLRRIISEATPHETPTATNGTRAATGG